MAYNLLALINSLSGLCRVLPPAVGLLAGLVAYGCGDGGATAPDASSDASAPPADASDGACAAEFFQGTVQFPDGTTHEACSPASADGIVVNFVRLASCETGVGSAFGVSDDGDAAWSISGRGDWYARAGTSMFDFSYSPTPPTESRCPPGDLVNCAPRSDRCEFEVIGAAEGPGDIVEARLVSPCMLQEYLTPSTWQPVLTSMRFRAHLTYNSVDAGLPCTPL